MVQLAIDLHLYCRGPTLQFALQSVAAMYHSTLGPAQDAFQAHTHDVTRLSMQKLLICGQNHKPA